MNTRKLYKFLISITFISSILFVAQTVAAAPTPVPANASATNEKSQTDSLKNAVTQAILNCLPSDARPAASTIESVSINEKNKEATVTLKDEFAYVPFNRSQISKMKKEVQKVLPESCKGYGVNLMIDGIDLESYVKDIDRVSNKNNNTRPFVKPVQPYNVAKKGMEEDIIALWHSHGRYFKNGSWQWQRPMLWQTAEDVYTMSYMLPFIVPMIENAGGYVMLPRERDFNVNEVIVDNDTNPGGDIFSQTTYKEVNGSKKWITGSGEGFIYDLQNFRDTENPFENGTYRQTTTVKNGKESKAQWFADIPKDGEYAVYVSYKTVPNSTEDALYTVYYDGGQRDFTVNQTMGGGTWIYLGTFPLRAGYSDKVPVVTLSNMSRLASDKIVTADAVKIGGGMGNIERSTKRNDVFYDPSTPDVVYVEEDVDYVGDMGDGSNNDASQTNGTSKSGSAPKFTTSGLPRFLEGARYWLHWAGIPESVYSPYHGSDDYKDDYTSRGHWVNYLAGGSSVLPGKKGLNIPVDVAMALHTDAGKRNDDSIVGTLGIYYTNGGKSYADGTPRMNSRIMTDMIMSQIVSDIKQTFEPRWTRRSMWDKSYLEARVPEVPTTLIELLSHQNFGDMQYGLDPAFRFLVSRAIYKGIGRFVAKRKGREFVVQPLPVQDFAINRVKKGEYRLSWQPRKDKLEPTADPTKYIIFERPEGKLGFQKIGETSSTHFEVKVNDNKIHSFRIVAANEGGMSFPSETLALREGTDNKKPVLIINAFTRVSAPLHYSDGNSAGFKSTEDFGVPYVYDLSFTGYQQNFSRNSGDSFGKSNSNFVSTVIGGNTFDYPAVHGEAIAAAGRGFVSASAGAVENGSVKLKDFNTVDLILGKQKMTVTGKGNLGVRFQTVPLKLQDEFVDFVDEGGNLLVSGQYVSSDLYDKRAGEYEVDFAEFTLGLADSGKTSTTKSGKVNAGKASGISSATYSYSNTLNPDNYIVEMPDVLAAAPDVVSEPFLTFSDTGDTAGLLIKIGKAKNVIMSVPLESFTDSKQRNKLVKELLDWIEKK